MTSALVFLLDGFEEIEAVATIDILRRAKVEVVVAGVESRTATGSHAIAVTADCLLSEVADRTFDAVVLPGGPATPRLGAEALVREIVERHAREGRWIGAICAAPSILAAYGLLDDKRAACHFSVESKMGNARLTNDPVAVDGNLVTSRGAGTAVLFALALVECLIDKAEADRIATAVCLTEGTPRLRS